MNDRAIFTSTTNHFNARYEHPPQSSHPSAAPELYNPYEPLRMEIDETNDKSVTNLRPATATICEEEKLESTSTISSTSTEPQTPNMAAAAAPDMLIILDWDNTLFPTTVIERILKQSKNNHYGFVCVGNGMIKLFNELATRTLLLLSELIATYGSHNIHIVTNSSHGWIQQSLAHAACISTRYKDIERLLFTHNITMLSAQSMFGSLYKEPVKWKTACITHLLDGDRTKAHYEHILSIGDQYTDHVAVQAAIQTVRYTPIHHMVKLKEEPVVKDMISEMEYIRAAFHLIFNVCDVLQPHVLDYHYEE
eukprot:243426_1